MNLPLVACSFIMTQLSGKLEDVKSCTDIHFDVEKLGSDHLNRLAEL